MEFIDELKLAVYESGMDNDFIEAIIYDLNDVRENGTDEELMECVDETLNILEGASYVQEGYGSRAAVQLGATYALDKGLGKLKNVKLSDVKSQFSNENIGRRAKQVATIGGGTVAIAAAMKKVDALKAERAKLQGKIAAYEQQIKAAPTEEMKGSIRTKINDCKNKIRIVNLKIVGLSGAEAGAAGVTLNQIGRI